MDIELHFQEKGNGEPFIFLHGNGENSSYFKNQIDYFSTRYHVIALDTRGHGKTPRGDAPFTIEQFSCDLYDFMKAHQLTSAMILGFSDGANIAMKFAITHPEMVKVLILNGGNLDAKGVKRTTQIPVEIGYRIAKHFSAKSPGAKKNAEMLVEPEDLPQITAPTLVICGTRDMIKESHAKKITRYIPNAKLVIIKGNHFVANKRPDKFNQEIGDFLKTV